MCGPLKGEAQERAELPTVHGVFSPLSLLPRCHAPSLCPPSPAQHMPSAVVIMSGAWQLSSRLIVPFSQHVLPAAGWNKGSAGCFGVSVLDRGSPHKVQGRAAGHCSLVLWLAFRFLPLWLEFGPGHAFQCLFSVCRTAWLGSCVGCGDRSSLEGNLEQGLG